MAANKQNNKTAPRGYQNAQPAAPVNPVTPAAPAKKSKFWQYAGWTVVSMALFNFMFGSDEPPEPPQPTYTPNRDTAPLPAPVANVPSAPAPAPVTPAAAEPVEEIITESSVPENTTEEIIPDATGADRAQAFGAIMSGIFRASAHHQKFSPSAQAQIASSVAYMMSRTAPDKAFYGDIYEQQSGERTYVASAPMGADKIAQAFICTQYNGNATSFFYATAVPDKAGAYNVTISDKILHSGYLRGQLLTEYYGKGQSCGYALQAVDTELNGSAETAAVNPPAYSRTPR